MRSKYFVERGSTLKGGEALPIEVVVGKDLLFWDAACGVLASEGDALVSWRCKAKVAADSCADVKGQVDDAVLLAVRHGVRWLEGGKRRGEATKKWVRGRGMEG